MAPLRVGSRHRIAVGEYVRAATVAEAHEEAVHGARVLAGGLDLYEELKAGRPTDRLVSLRGLDELASIVRRGSTLKIGAMVTHAELVRAPLVRQHLPSLAALWHTVGSHRVRAQGTVGGNLVTGAAEYDGPPAFAVLGACLRTGGQEVLSVDRAPFLAGTGLLTHVLVDVGGSVWLGAERALKPAIATWLAVRSSPEGVVAVRLALTTSAARPILLEHRWPQPVAPGEVGSAADAAVSELLARCPRLPDDTLASGSFRAAVAAVQARRLLSRFRDER